MAKKITLPIEVYNLDEEGFHLFISVKMGDITTRMLIDTGASRTVVDKVFLQQNFPDLKMEANENPATGAGTNTLQTEIATLSELHIGELQLSNYLVAVLDMKHVNQTYEAIGAPAIHGVIGSDVLVACKAVISLKKKRLRLRQPSN